MKGKKFLAAIISAAMFTSCAGTMGLGTFAEDGEVTAAVVTGTFGGHTYIVVQEELTPIEAQAVCEELGGYLASVTSQEEQDFIAGLCKQVDYDSFWIGGSDDDSEGEWYWLNGEPWDYTNWYPGGAVGTYEPNNGLGAGDDYAAMNRQRDYMWIDAFGGYDNYTQKWYFVLEKDSADVQPVSGEHRYQVIDKGMTWDEAEAYCESLGGHLATITSQEEQDTVSAMVAGAAKKNYWLGGYKNEDNELFWITGEDFVYSSWGSGEPNNSRAFEDKVMMWSSNGLWNDLRADGVYDSNYGIENLGFICEWDSIYDEYRPASSFGGFISDIKVVGIDAGDDAIATAKKMLTDEGYTVIDYDLNLNCRSGSDYIYLGYKTTDNFNDAIKDIIVVDKSKPADDYIVEQNGASYHLCPYDGTGHFTYLNGDLNSNASGNDGHFFYTKDNVFDGAVSGIFFNSDPTGAVCDFDLNGGASTGEKASSTPDRPDHEIYMHLTYSLGGNLISFGDHIYKRFDFGMTWDEAEAYCESLGGHLATITSQEEQDVITELVTGAAKNCYWIGMYRTEDKSFAWVTGEKISYTNWKVNNPNNTGGNQNAVHTYSVEYAPENNKIGEWNDLNGDGTWSSDKFFGLENFGFICEWDGNSADGSTVWNGHKYQVIDKGMTWDEAKEYCESLGGHLVTITSEDEEKFVENLIDKYTKITYHIGLTDDGKKNYSWVTGETFDYNNDISAADAQSYQYTYVIVSKNADEKYLHIWADHDDVLRGDMWDYTKSGFVCEWDDSTGADGFDAYQRIQGEDYDDDLSYGIQRTDTTNHDAADSDGGVAGWIGADDYAVYDFVNFGSGTPAKSITVRASNPTGSPVDITVYTVEYDPEGDAYVPYEVGTVTVEPTGSWNSYKTFSANVSDTTGSYIVSLYFNGSVNLDWFTFSKTSISETAEATLYGDANLDGKVTVADAVAIMQHIGNRDKYGLKPQGLANADVDGAAGVTGKDALVIQQVDAKMYKQTDLPLKAK